MSKKDEKAQCINCLYFDNSNHKNDERTKHAGICKKWCEITFCRDSCKQYLTVSIAPDWQNVVTPKPIENQISLF